MASSSENKAILALVAAGALLAFFSILFFIPVTLVFNALEGMLPGVPFLIAIPDILVGIPIYMISSRVLLGLGMKIKSVSDLAKAVLMIFIVASILLLMLVFMMPFFMGMVLPGYPGCGGLCDPCFIYDLPADSWNPLYAHECSADLEGDISSLGIACSMQKLCVYSTRYLLYSGPHNPLTLFIAGFLTRRLLRIR